MKQAVVTIVQNGVQIATASSDVTRLRALQDFGIGILLAELEKVKKR